MTPSRGGPAFARPRTSSRRAPKAKAHRTFPAPASVADQVGAALLIILLLPRLVRFLYPAVWVEDDFYLEAAWLVSAGMRPYIDFVHPHFPLLEWIAAGYFKIFGASHFSIELLNQAAIYVTSVLTFKLAVRVTTRRAAICAAILYATSALVFRYHVYERECFVAPLVLAAAILALEEREPWYRRVGWQAAAMVAASLIKLTALVPAAVIFVFIAATRRRLREAIAFALAVAAGLAAFTLFCYWLYGPEFLFQTFLFQLLKGGLGRASVMAYPLQILDLQFAMLIVGLAALGAEGAIAGGMVLVLAMIAAEYAFFGVLSPTAWGHNYLEALPFIAIVGGAGVNWMLALAEVAIGKGAGDSGRAGIRLAGCAVFVLISLVWIAPLENENWQQDSVYGFGFVPRREISQLATALRGASRRDDDVVAPAFLCFEANRRELIRFPETYGVWREAELEYRRDGLQAARAHLGGENFFALIVETAHFWRDPLTDAVRGAKLNAFIADSEIQLLPLVISPVLLPADFSKTLTDRGFRPELTTDHYTLWTRTAARPP